ncbi:MAG: T9SS type A sorting domain-containing protein [bacterium]|nr:T9SS type A sorting domain-containing protein [bacterium]
MMASHVTYNHWETNDGDLRSWTSRSRMNPIYPFGETDLVMQAINLDQDAQDELLVMSRLTTDPDTRFVRCWDPDSNIAPNFIESTDLLEAFDYPGFPLPSMFGNFDNDASFDGVTPTASGWLHYERNGSMWSLVDTINASAFSEYLSFFAADINADGDTEFGAYEPGIDCNCMSATIVDHNLGDVEITTNHFNLILFPGDYDGDGSTEAFLDSYELTLPSRLIRFVPGYPYAYLELENQYTMNSPFVYSRTQDGQHKLYGIMNNHAFQVGSWSLERAAYAIQWSDTGWSLNPPSFTWGKILDGNEADIWDDEAMERLVRMDIGTSAQNIIWTVGYGSLARFYNNADTMFLNPRIGDVEGDNAGEFAAYVSWGAPTGIYFFELERSGGELIARHKPELSVGLPTANITEFQMADVDNDGHAEIFVGTVFWHAYFWRNGQWEDHSTTFPQGVGPNLNFADFEGDGDVDIFAANGVWLSLTPTDADDVPEFAPATISLVAYPNPFNAQTTIEFSLQKAAFVTLSLYDIQGRAVRALTAQGMVAGSHRLNFSANDLPSGVYYASLRAGESSATQKLLLLK